MTNESPVKAIFRLLLCFLITAAVLLGFLLLSTLVPRETIRPQMQSSAELLCKGKLFGEVLPGVDSSRIDRYADSILLGIAWQYDSRNALRSVMESSYFHLVYQNENENLRDAVEQDYPPNHQYLRYWHGSAGVVRILMAVLTLPQIYTFHAIVFSLLLLGLIYRLLRRGELIGAAAFLTGMIGISLWFVPLSLEYTWVFLILLIQMHLILLPSFPKDWSCRCLFFLISGMVTNYLDFLTCETVTLLVPLLFLIYLDHRLDRKMAGWRTLTKTVVYWLIGYGGMFLLKWGLAGLVMGENPLPYVAGHVGERVAGSVGVGFFREWLDILLRNITCLFPLNYGTTGIIAGVLLILAAVYFGFVHHRVSIQGKTHANSSDADANSIDDVSPESEESLHRNELNKGLIARYAVIALIPYLRFLAMANHSYLHYFFTYRAQCTSLIALVLIVGCYRHRTVQ